MIIAVVSYGVLIVIMDLAFASTRQLKIFYLPLLVELLIIGLGILALFFKVPERWFKRSKVVNLYLNSSIIYTIFLINFLFELHNIFYYTKTPKPQNPLNPITLNNSFRLNPNCLLLKISFFV